MPDQEPRDDLFADTLADMAKIATNEPLATAPDEPRDSVGLRWLKFASLIILPAVVVGLAFVFVHYYYSFSARTTNRQQTEANHIKHDTIAAMKLRFAIGSVLGGSLGMIYVVRCLVRKTDP